MALLTVTNLSSTKIFLRDLYVELEAGQTKSATRSQAEISSMYGLQQAMQAGTISVAITPSSEEIASGFSLGGSLAFANTVAAEDHDFSNVQNGTSCYIETYRALFIYNKTSTATVLANTILAPTGGGRLFRQGVLSSEWLLQATWYIDPVAGSDENVGSLALPIKTWKELRARWGVTPKLSQTTTVTILSSLPSTDIVDLSNVDTSQFILQIIGTPTVSAVGTLTGVTPVDASLNQAYVLTNTSVADWTSHIGKTIRITSGTRTNDYGVIDENLGGGAVKVTGLIDGSFSSNTSTAPVGADPVVGNTYEVLDNTATTITPSGNGAPHNRNIRFFALCVSAANNFYSTKDVLASSVNTFFRCKIIFGIASGGFGYVGCWIDNSFASRISNGYSTMSGCRVTNVEYFSVFSGTLNLLGNSILRCRIKSESESAFLQLSYPQSNAKFRACGMYGTLQVEAQRGGVINVTDKLYGSITTTLGTIVLDNITAGPGNWRYGHRLGYTGSPTVVASNGVDFYLNGVTMFLPDLEASAGGVLPILAECKTWAQLTAPPFSGKLFYSRTATSIVPT